MTAGRFLGAAAAVLAVLGAGELASRRLLPDVPSCVEAQRNPYRFRGWPEYVEQHETAPGVKRLVLLTNSQGYAGEIPAYKIYPYRLEMLLRGEGAGGSTRWEVLNWATDGITTIEQSILAAYLQTLTPDVVLVVTGYADYAVEHDGQGFLYCRSDVPRLATRLPVFTRLPPDYRRRHLKLEDTVTFLLRDRLACLRMREYGWSWLESRLPGVHEMFYAPHVNYLPWDIKARPWIRPLRRPAGRPEDPVLRYGPESVAMLRDYLDLLTHISARVIVVNEPVRTHEDDYRAGWHLAFQEDLRELTETYGLTLWDLYSAVPADQFITSSHFHPRAHAAFAAMLAERLQAELAGDAL
ncbi:MAG: hypothetical protein JW951_03280 [Lentisphaerae bacterium]|nr:hypothetical protein [Lentisphaerota bacterium]